MCNKPNIDWTKTLEAFDPDSPGRLPRPAKVLCHNYRLKSGLTCRLVLVENEHDSSTHLYYHNGTIVQPFTPVLRNKTKKVTRWYNLYRSGPGVIFFTTHQDAASRANYASDLLEIRSIEIEEPL